MVLREVVLAGPGLGVVGGLRGVVGEGSVSMAVNWVAIACRGRLGILYHVV